MTRNKVFFFSLFMSDAIASECIAIIIHCGLLDNRSLQPNGTVTHFLEMYCGILLHHKVLFLKGRTGGGKDF